MSLTYHTLVLFHRLKKDGYLEGSKRLIEIGAQQLNNTFLESKEQVDALGELFGIRTPFKLAMPVKSFTVHGAIEHLPTDAPFARHFYSWLGFEYACVDIDESPHSIPLDLNFDTVPEEHKGRFHIVTNFGTTEHVANQLNAFGVIHDLTAPGGIMIHDLPAQGMMNHGLVNYNPKFFWMLARSNGYDTLLFNLNAKGQYYDLPQNIVDFVTAYVDLDTGQPGQRPAYHTSDVGIRIVLRKAFDIPFVPPLDVPTGTKTDNGMLKERYWTVFKPNAFGRFARHGGVVDARTDMFPPPKSLFRRCMRRLGRMFFRSGA